MEQVEQAVAEVEQAVAEVEQAVAEVEQAAAEVEQAAAEVVELLRCRDNKLDRMKISNSVLVNENKRGAALLVSLWVLIILSLITGSFAFEMKLESMLVSHQRKKFQAEALALSGVEYAKALLDQRQFAKELEIEDLPEDENDGFMQAALYIKRGLAVHNLSQEFGDGKFTISIEAEESKRNANLMTRNDWLDIFEMAGVPNTDWDEMIDCLEDWKDEGDLHKLNGAESDDPFYEDQGYECKNGPLDSVEELLLVKGWGEDILYGKPQDDEGDAIYGIAELLTVWGDGKVNLNSADTNVFLSLTEFDDWMLEDIMERRKGLDGEEGTLDDGFKNLNEAGVDGGGFKLQTEFVKVTSIGEISGIQYRVSCIFLLKEKSAVPMFWEEGPVY
ncbi:MAG: general secretion pathway protein GspK [Kiritimatiellales bacterium]|nr:general secretion pathway protein GspK [Kiritimatiellales bacterium]